MNTNQIETTPFYWDCECCENYIHHCTEKICKSCNAEWEYQPDSRIDEIVLDDILYPHTPERNAFILKELSNHIGEDQMKTFVRKIVSEDK